MIHHFSLFFFHSSCCCCCRHTLVTFWLPWIRSNLCLSTARKCQITIKPARTHATSFRRMCTPLPNSASAKWYALNSRSVFWFQVCYISTVAWFSLIIIHLNHFYLIVLGESGSGKTETCKYLVQHLLNRTRPLEVFLNSKIQQV